MFSLLYRKVLRIVRTVEKNNHVKMASILWAEFLPPKVFFRNDHESLSSIVRRSFEMGDKEKDISLAFAFIKDRDKHIFSISVLSMLQDLDFSSNFSLTNVLCVMSSILRSSELINVSELNGYIKYYQNFMATISSTIASGINNLYPKLEYSGRTAEIKQILQYIVKTTGFTSDDTHSLCSTLVSVAESQHASESILNIIMHILLNALHICSRIVIENNVMILEIRIDEETTFFFSWSSGMGSDINQYTDHLCRTGSTRAASVRDIYILLVQKQLLHKRTLTTFQISICKQQILFLLGRR